LANCSVDEAVRLRDWNWYTLRGALSINISQEGGDPAAIKELCESGYEMFRSINK